MDRRISAEVPDNRTVNPVAVKNVGSSGLGAVPAEAPKFWMTAARKGSALVGK